jgi:cobalt-zinc-cadmium efflux system outer membrane protein
MTRLQRAGICAGLVSLCSILLPGCRAARTVNVQTPPQTAVVSPRLSPAGAGQPVAKATVAQSSTAVESPAAVRQVTHRQPTETPERLPVPEEIVVPQASDGLFAADRELSLPKLLDLVQARNASLDAMTNAWRAASQRYPQAIALDDPTLMAMMAPASFNSGQVQPAYVLGGSQKVPWFGKRELRGREAQAAANASFHEVRDARLQIAESTRLAFYEYYLLDRQLELNRQSVEILGELRDTAQVKYENNQVTQQDVLQADLELAGIERRKLELERMYRVAIARINTLLQRYPDQPLPPPPARLTAGIDPPPADLLRQMAVTARPDLASLSARIRAEEAAVALAYKQYYPDAEFYGKYDSFWQPAATQSDLRAQVGVNMNVPIYRRKLQAAVCEAEFRLNQRRAEYRQRAADVQYEVQAAYEQVLEARLAVQIYSDKLLPAAEQNLDAARTNYDVGKITFLGLLSAQQQLVAQREQYQQALAAYHSRLAELERVVGGPLPEMAGAESTRK